MPRTTAATSLRPRQIQELDLALERERHWLVDHIRALETPADITAPPAARPAPAPDSPGRASSEVDLPALEPLVGVLAEYLASELAPEDTRAVLDRAYQERLQEIDDAIDRIAADSYGVCERCGGDIYPPRLKRIPWTRHCRRCAEALALEGIHRTVVPSTAEATNAVVEYGLAKVLAH